MQDLPPIPILGHVDHVMCHVHLCFASEEETMLCQHSKSGWITTKSSSISSLFLFGYTIEYYRYIISHNWSYMYIYIYINQLR